VYNIAVFFVFCSNYLAEVLIIFFQRSLILALSMSIHPMSQTFNQILPIRKNSVLIFADLNKTMRLISCQFCLVSHLVCMLGYICLCPKMAALDTIHFPTNTSSLSQFHSHTELVLVIV